MVFNMLTEHEEQCMFVEWLERKGLKFGSIPNGTYAPHPRTRVKNHAAGLRPGLPDMMIITPKGLLFIEMKRVKRGKLSDAQKEWIDSLNTCKGVEAAVCKGYVEATAFVSQFLE